MTRHDDMLYVALMRDEVRGVLKAVEGCSRGGVCGRVLSEAKTVYVAPDATMADNESAHQERAEGGVG